MYEEIIRAHRGELLAAETMVKHRMDLAEFLRLEKLERAVKVTRSRVGAPIAAILKTNN